MNFEIEKLNQLYRQYGYEVVGKSEGIMVYLYKKARYFGADIVEIGDVPVTSEALENIKSGYQKIGYAVNVKNYQSIFEAEEELFKSFFSFDSTRQRLRRKYDEFVRKQTEKLGGVPYIYVNCQYDEFSNDKSEGSLTEEVKKILDQDGPNLIIIEAAAGYGKTCSAYEIIKDITADSRLRNPIFTELSRNRTAKIFKYILLDAIEVEYPTLYTELVQYEVNKGRIPLIIDGFDELLEKYSIDGNNPHSVFDEAETMLNTIGNVLNGNAKIILTSRRTAIFAGLQFNEWLKKWGNKFTVTRFSIREPKISSWLGRDRVEKIKSSNLTIQNIANPVLLTYLRSLSDESFDDHLTTPELVVKKYFDNMLERERVRQDLVLLPQQQYDIFKNVTKMLIEFDDSVEDKDFFKQIIIDQNRKLLESARVLYTEDKPTVEELADKLVNHCLLDRKGNNEDQVGFINEFVFGYFIGDVMCETKQVEIERLFSTYMIELGATAYKVQNKSNKQLLWEKINPIYDRFPSTSLFNFDVSLLSRISRGYNEVVFESLSSFEINFDESHVFDSSVFLKCYFVKCKFSLSAFKAVTFIGCYFDKCSVENGDLLNKDYQASFINCKEHNCNIFNPDHYSLDTGVVDTKKEKEYRVKVLRELWSIDKDFKHQHYLQLMKAFDKKERRNVLKALEDLSVNFSLISIEGTDIHFTINKITEVKKMLNL